MDAAATLAKSERVFVLVIPSEVEESRVATMQVTPRDPSTSLRMTGDAARLLFFVATVLIVPALISQMVPTRTAFNGKPIARLRAQQPAVVLIGDSILGSAIDPRLIEEQLGDDLRVELLWNGGAASASWYLIMKNWLVPSGIRPQLCAIFFRDRMLTDASFRTTPTYRHFLESLRHEDEPVVDAVLGGSSGEGVLQRGVARIYPLSERRHVQQEKISRAAFAIAALSSRGAKTLRRRVNETFDVARLRDEVMPESTAVSAEVAEPFDPDPRRNFLQHIVETASAAGIRLCFVRVKRHPDASGHVAQSEELRRYTFDLQRWLNARGCGFIDLSGESAFTADMYLKENDDHIAPGAKPHSTELFAQKLRPLLQR